MAARFQITTRWSKGEVLTVDIADRENAYRFAWGILKAPGCNEAKVLDREQDHVTEVT